MHPVIQSACLSVCPSRRFRLSLFCVSATPVCPVWLVYPQFRPFFSPFCTGFPYCSSSPAGPTAAQVIGYRLTQLRPVSGTINALVGPRSHSPRIEGFSEHLTFTSQRPALLESVLTWFHYLFSLIPLANCAYEYECMQGASSSRLIANKKTIVSTELLAKLLTGTQKPVSRF